jgi:periplasmic divalent cation tolerance protein
MQDYIQVVTTVGSEADADRIARTLVEERLAACVQISAPIVSVYRWKGAVETSREWQCSAKTRLDLRDEVMATIQRLHSYELPEIVAIPILGGSEAYMAWLEGELRPKTSEKS